MLQFYELSLTNWSQEEIYHFNTTSVTGLKCLLFILRLLFYALDKNVYKTPNYLIMKKETIPFFDPTN